MSDSFSSSASTARSCLRGGAEGPPGHFNDRLKASRLQTDVQSSATLDDTLPHKTNEESENDINVISPRPFAKVKPWDPTFHDYFVREMADDMHSDKCNVPGSSTLAPALNHVPDSITVTAPPIPENGHTDEQLLYFQSKARELCHAGKIDDEISATLNCSLECVWDYLNLFAAQDGQEKLLRHREEQKMLGYVMEPWTRRVFKCMVRYGSSSEDIASALELDMVAVKNCKTLLDNGLHVMMVRPGRLWWTSEEEDRLTKLYLAGKTLRELAAHFGRNFNAVIRKCTKLDKSTLPGLSEYKEFRVRQFEADVFGRWNGTLTSRIKDLEHQGHVAEEIARQMHMPIATVTARLQRTLPLLA